MTTWHESAAAAFDAVAVPLVGSRAAVAGVLGIHATTYGRAVNGGRDGTLAATRWCARWSEVRPEVIGLRFDGGQGLWQAYVMGVRE